MYNLDSRTAKDLLESRNVSYQERGGELILACLFNNCDEDSRANEAHLYINAHTGQYHCKKCGESGNLSGIQKVLGIENLTKVNTRTHTKSQLTVETVTKAHSSLPDSLRQWLHQRGVTDEAITEYQLGFGHYYGLDWLTIPVFDVDGHPLFFKLRRLPKDDKSAAKYMFWPKGSQTALYNAQKISRDETTLMICEGELDTIVTFTHQLIPSVSSTAGAASFDISWLDSFSSLEKIYVSYDKDKAGAEGATTLIEKLAKKLPSTTIYKVSLPEEMPEKSDLTDYYLKYGQNPDQLIEDLAELTAGPDPIDVSKFNVMNSDDVIKVLGQTIKRDDENKLVTFLCQLSAYTEDSQLNLSFNAPSSSGKSFIPIEVARLFPQEDVLELGHTSPTSFFHGRSQFNQETEEHLVDLSRKVIVFLDQPHTMLLEYLRPILSHDKKEIRVQITDKQQKNGLRAKNIVLRGYPAVIFCSAGLRLDEQEATRFLLLSPEISQEKIRAGVIESLRRNVDPEGYQAALDENTDRSLLKARILAIRRSGVTNILIKDKAMIERRFLSSAKKLKPRHQRDIKRLVSLIKIFALLNLWWRNKDGGTIFASESDTIEAFKIWDKISRSQELNIPPYLYQMYEDIILSAFNDKNDDRGDGFVNITGKIGVTRQEVMTKHYEVYGRPLDSIAFRQQMIPMLNQAGLISEEPDPNDKRGKLIYPQSNEKNSELRGGVEIFSQEEISEKSIDFGDFEPAI